MGSENLLNIIIMVTVFSLIFSIWCICVFLWLGQYLTRLQVVQKRLGIVKKKETDESRTLRLWRELQQDAEASHLATKLTLRERLERVGQDAGWRTPIQTVVSGVIGAASLAFVLIYLNGGGIPLGLGISAAIVFLFWGYTRRRISKRASLFEKQLVDALGIAARALRAGHPLVGAFQLVAEEIGEPLGSIFSRICQEQSLGLDLKDSIHKVTRTTHNSELKLFATAVSIQFESGGNLADLMDSLASVIRARMRLNRRVRVITAQTQFSKVILIALPLVLFIVLNIISPQYMQSFYTTTVGRYMLGIVVASVLFGSWAMHRLSILRF
jgi:tight adherence protein B